MKRKSKETQKSFKNRSKKTLNNPIFDLFGEIIVTHFDIYIWVAVITKGRFLGNLNRYNYYVETWNVSEKVKFNKKTGYFEQIMAEYYQYWHLRVWQPDFNRVAKAHLLPS